MSHDAKAEPTFLGRTVNALTVHCRGLLGALVPILMIVFMYFVMARDNTVESNKKKKLEIMWWTMLWWSLVKPIDLPIIGLVPFFAAPMFVVTKENYIAEWYFSEALIMFLIGGMVMMVLNACSFDKRLTYWIFNLNSIFTPKMFLFKVSLAAWFTSVVSYRLIASGNVMDMAVNAFSEAAISNPRAQSDFSQIKQIIYGSIIQSSCIGSIVFIHATYHVLAAKGFIDDYNYMNWTLANRKNPRQPESDSTPERFFRMTISDSFGGNVSEENASDSYLYTPYTLPFVEPTLADVTFTLPETAFTLPDAAFTLEKSENDNQEMEENGTLEKAENDLVAVSSETERKKRFSVYEEEDLSSQRKVYVRLKRQEEGEGEKFKAKESIPYIPYLFYAIPLSILLYVVNFIYNAWKISRIQEIDSPFPYTVEAVKKSIAAVGKNIPTQITSHEILSLFSFVVITAVLVTRNAWNKTLATEGSVICAGLVLLQLLPKTLSFTKSLSMKKNSQFKDQRPESAWLNFKYCNKFTLYSYMLILGSGWAMMNIAYYVKFDLEVTSRILKGLINKEYGFALFASIFICGILANIINPIAVVAYVLPLIFIASVGAKDEEIYKKTHFLMLACSIATTFNFCRPFDGMPSRYILSQAKTPKERVHCEGLGNLILCCLTLAIFTLHAAAEVYNLCKKCKYGPANT